MTDICVLDAYPGWGKSTKMIDMIKNDTTDNKYLVITPYLVEAHRYAGTEYEENIKKHKNREDEVVILPILTNKRFTYTNEGHSCYPNRRFKHPVDYGKGKSDSLKRLIDGGHDIVSTHALFSLLTQDIYALLEYNNYVLVIDECVDVAYQYTGKTQEQVSKLFETGLLYCERNGTVRWDKTDEGLDYKDILFPEIKRLADNGNLVSLNESRKVLIWRFPVDFLMCFDRIHILTYRFKNSLMDMYFKKYNISYNIEMHEPDMRLLENNICVLDNKKMNSVGKRINSLSKYSFRGDIKNNKGIMCATLKKHMTNFVKNICKANTERIMWTCFKDYKKHLKGPGYSKNCWLPMNLKAVNDHCEKDVVMYCVNRYINPHVAKFLNVTDEQEDFWALSELIQFLFRSAIRNGNKINVYIASVRMRSLLLSWLEN